MTRETSAEDRTRSVIEQFYDHSLRADLEGLAKVLHSDVVVHEPASLPYGGAHVGRDEVLQLMAQLHSLIEERKRLLASGMHTTRSQVGHACCPLRWY